MSKRIGMLWGDLEEVRAYRDLQSEHFDFGKGLITNDCEESEDAYYEMREQDLELLLGDYLKPWYGDLEPQHENLRVSRKVRDNKYIRKGIRKKILRDLQSKNVYQVYEKEDKETGNRYLKMVYYCGRRKLAKKMTNKIIRQSKQSINLQNGEYRKVYNYFWEVY